MSLKWFALLLMLVPLLLGATSSELAERRFQRQQVEDAIRQLLPSDSMGQENQ